MLRSMSLWPPSPSFGNLENMRKEPFVPLHSSEFPIDFPNAVGYTSGTILSIAQAPCPVTLNQWRTRHERQTHHKGQLAMQAVSPPLIRKSRYRIDAAILLKTSLRLHLGWFWHKYAMVSQFFFNVYLAAIILTSARCFSSTFSRWHLLLQQSKHCLRLVNPAFLRKLLLHQQDGCWMKMLHSIKQPRWWSWDCIWLHRICKSSTRWPWM